MPRIFPPHSFQAVSQMSERIGLVVGNGFTMDYWYGSKFAGLDVSSPLSWTLNVNGIPLLDLLPYLKTALATAKSKAPDAKDYDILREVIKYGVEHEVQVDCEARHFLSYAYRWLSNEIGGPIRGPLGSRAMEEWRWWKWLEINKARILGAVSFNYDLILEIAFTAVGCRVINNPKDSALPNCVRLFKPHGSGDFDIHGVQSTDETGKPMVGVRYPLRGHMRLINGELRLLPRALWPDHGPCVPLIVLPYEYNPYKGHHWCRPGFDHIAELAKEYTHCIFMGLSYHPADREEIDIFISQTSKDCTIIHANRSPDPNFTKTVEESGRRLIEWNDGPEPKLP